MSILLVEPGTLPELVRLRINAALTALNGMLSPKASVTPTNKGDLVIQATSNTSLTFKYRGSDGTVRSASLTLT